ncbi:hypothetical protein LTR49_027513 [Elasticomyces elasticus]|nr:hypothetical protein LTR49_027513 [Elasticomyces elasticus]
MESTSPIIDPLAASNEESISLSSNPRSRLLHDDVSSATLSAREKEEDSGAALGCQPLSPLTSDVSPVSEDDDETETETFRMEPDRGTKPAAVEFDTDDGTSSITDEPFSSPLAHKGRHIPQTSIQRAPTPAIPKTASRSHPHVVKRDRCAKGSSQIERPRDAIRATYGKFGLDAQRLIIRMKVLQKRRDELLASLTVVDDPGTGSADVDLIKGLCNLYCEPVYPQDMTDLTRALRQRQKLTKDVVNLLQCLESFALVVTKYHTSTMEGWSMHDLRRVSDHHCLHYVLLHLDEGWRGLHVMVVIYLLRAGVRKLQDYFASATRLSAILLLLQGLNDADMIRQHAERMRQLISKALPGQESRIGQMTPLGMLHKMTKGFMPQGAVESALGYDSQYLERAVAQPIGVSYIWTPWSVRIVIALRLGPMY